MSSSRVWLERIAVVLPAIVVSHLLGTAGYPPVQRVLAGLGAGLVTIAVLAVLKRRRGSA